MSTRAEREVILATANIVRGDPLVMGLVDFARDLVAELNARDELEEAAARRIAELAKALEKLTDARPWLFNCVRAKDGGRGGIHSVALNELLDAAETALEVFRKEEES